MLRNRIPVLISRVPQVTNVSTFRRAVAPILDADGTYDHDAIYDSFCIAK